MAWCYREWKRACEKAKLPADLRIYDLRRSAIRNLVHAGVAQATAMKISGHRTAEAFRRYMVENSEDTANAIMRAYEYVQRKKERKRQATPAPDADKTRTSGGKSEES
jgi:integrase